MKNQKNITMDKLAKKYWDGQTTPQEEHTLLLQLKDKPSLTPDEEALLTLLEDVAPTLAVRTEWLEEDESALFDAMMQQREPHQTSTPLLPSPSLTHRHTPPKKIWRTHLLRASLAAAMLCGAIWLVRLAVLSVPDTSQAVTYIYGNRVEDEQMALDMMEHTMGEFFAENEVETTLGDIFQ